MNEVLSVPKNAFVSAAVTQSALLIDARTYYCTVYRALERAESYVVVSGWQLDSEVKLLRGEDAATATRPVKLLEFLAALCEDRPGLTIYVLGWDFSPVYAGERELNTREKFRAAHPRIRFEWDAHPELRGSHHQKFVVVDGAVAFVGGIDLCDARWDDRTHHAHNPHRVDVSGEPCKPYHDVQAAFTGPLVAAVAEVFVDRWALATGDRLDLHAPAEAEPRFDLNELSDGRAEAVHAERAALSRTRADCRAEPALVGEILQLFSDAIRSAERLIYAETQYLTSRTLARLLVSRLSDSSLPKLELIFVMPHGADSAMEKMVLEDAQETALKEVLDAGKTNGHGVCIMYPASLDPLGEERPTFIHSKVLIVDDRLLVVGSANFTERSLALDSELCVTWECSGTNDAVSECIRNIRTRLLGEHSGLPPEEFDIDRGLCEKIDALLASKSTRLRTREVGKAGVLGVLLAEVFDPGSPELTRSVRVG